MSELSSSCKLGILSRPDGSALYSEGATTVVAGIYGPVEVKANKILVDKAVIEAHYRPKSGFPGVEDRLHESIIRNVCDNAVAVALHPRSSVVVVIQELQNSGQLLSCALNAICLAALDAGIDMKCMFGAVTCFLDAQDSMGIIAPAQHEDIKASFMFVFDSVEKNVISSHTEGRFTTQQFKSAISLCRQQVEKIFEFFKESLAIK